MELQNERNEMVIINSVFVLEEKEWQSCASHSSGCCFMLLSVCLFESVLSRRVVHSGCCLTTAHHYVWEGISSLPPSAQIPTVITQLLEPLTGHSIQFSLKCGS
jgi:hypothetical protein